MLSGRRLIATVTGCERSFSPQPIGSAIGLVRAHRTSSTPAGDANLVENVKEIILDGMLAQIQFGRDFSVAQAICDQMHDRLLTLGCSNLQQLSVRVRTGGV